MELKERMNPKLWLIIGGVVQLGFAIWLMVDASSFAESGWGTMTERELEIATAYELFWGWFSVPWGLWALMVAFLASGQAQARIAGLTGAMLVVHGGVFFFLADGSGYGTEGPGPLFAGLFFLTIIAVAVSGFLNWNTDDSAPAQEA